MVGERDLLQRSNGENLKELCTRLRDCDSCEFKSASVSYDEIEADKDWPCNGCDNYSEIRKFGDVLWDSDLKIEEILAKGPDITTEEAFFLLEEGVTKRRIQEALEISSDLMKDFVWRLANTKAKG